MSFIYAVRSAVIQYRSVAGRANRAEYWWFALFNTLVAVAVALVSGWVVAIAIPEASVATGSALVGLAVSLALLVLLPPSVTVTVRRLHDINRSGWWYLLSFVPLGGLVLLVFTVVAGDPRMNRYGPPPSQLAEYPLSERRYPSTDRAGLRSGASLLALLGLMFAGCAGIFVLHAGLGAQTTWSGLDGMWLLMACLGFGFALVSLVWFTFAAAAAASGFAARSALPKSS